MLQKPRNTFRVLPQYQPLMRELGIDAQAVFTHPQIVPWRKLDDRENCTLDATSDGRPIRLHVKRYFPARGFATPAEDEVQAINFLLHEQIPTVPLVGWGKLIDRRSFVITEDLAGYRDAEKLVAAGMPFESLLNSTADLAAKLHKSGLHHRDLYLCHFFAKADDPNDVRLIDVARVSRLGGVFTRNRWIIKDLAQFWYSTVSLSVSGEQRERWLKRYAEARGIEATPRMRRAIAQKVSWIEKHDAKLKQAQPTRNVSIPQSPPICPHPNPLPDGEGTRP